MSDEEFTPTEWEVREQYAASNIHAEAEFDRMIASVERAAAEKALTDAVDQVTAKAKAYADSAIGLRAEKEWADSSRYSNYAAGLDMAANEIHKAAEAYRQEREEQ